MLEAKKRGGAKEGAKQVPRAFYAAGSSAGYSRQRQGIRRRPIRQGILFEVGPQGFDRVEFRGIGREQYAGDVSSPQRLLHATRPVARQAVPNQQHGPAQMIGQIAQELDQPGDGHVGVGAQGKIQSHTLASGRHGQRRNTGDLLAGAPALVQHGRPSAGRPTATDQRGQQQAAFIHKDQRSVQAPGVFFTCGQTARTQRRMARSSRSRARRSGFCGLQPKPWSRRPRWST